MKFNPNRVGVSLAVALSVAYTVMVGVGHFAPNLAATLDQCLLHFHAADFTITQYFSGVVQTAVYSYIVGAFFASVFNNLGK